jgi:cytochrome c-type biogenesis protein CcmH/NrfF
MSIRPWQASSMVFLFLTLLYWSDFRVNLTVRGFPVQAYFPQTAIGQMASVNGSKPTSATTLGPFPNVNTAGSPKTNLTAILLSSEAKKMQNDLIPKENSSSYYGLKFSLATFNQQRQWSAQIQEDPSWKARYDSIVSSTYHPCCGANIGTNDCGHAIAMTGLVKKMLQDGKSDQEIKSELMMWEKYYFPRHYVIVALALKKMGKSLDQMDLSPNYSSIAVETAAGNYLIYS